ncbi:MAG: hypothetical protein EA370_00260 [Wenzhouxiangella sp.]|nr:MAG: hypothetical protein EA370_00260 [Wenzhouxiangella sp.]
MNNRDVHHHRLFWEPDREFERLNEWVEPKAFAFGDMDILEEKNLRQIAENYFKCAELLIDRVFKNDLEDFVAQFPAIYLIRHSIELLLKHAILCQTRKAAPKSHCLSDLAKDVSGIEPWAMGRIKELDEIDPRSVELRYGGVGERAQGFIGSELHFFREAMRVLYAHLCAVADAKDQGTES